MSLDLDLFLEKFDTHIQNLRTLSIFLDETLQQPSLPDSAADVLCELSGQVGSLNGRLLRARFTLKGTLDTQGEEEGDRERGRHQGGMKRKASSEVVAASKAVKRDGGLGGGIEGEGHTLKRKAGREGAREKGEGKENKRRSITDGTEIGHGDDEVSDVGVEPAYERRSNSDDNTHPQPQTKDRPHRGAHIQPTPSTSNQDSTTNPTTASPDPALNTNTNTNPSDDYEVQYVDISSVVLQHLRSGPSGHLWGGPVTGKRKRDAYIDDDGEEERYSSQYDDAADQDADTDAPSSAAGSRITSPTKRIRTWGEFEGRREGGAKRKNEDGDEDVREGVGGGFGDMDGREDGRSKRMRTF